MKHIARVASVAAALAVAVSAAPAQAGFLSKLLGYKTITITKTAAWTASKPVVVKDSSGNVTITRTSCACVEITARVTAKDEALAEHPHLTVSNDPSAMVIDVALTPPDDLGTRDIAIDYEIAIPKGAPLDAATDNGNVRIEHVATNVSATSRNGNIDVTIDPAWVGTSIVLRSENGNVTLHASPGLRGRVEATTANGDVRDELHVQDPSGKPRIHLSTENGNVTIEAARN